MAVTWFWLLAVNLIGAWKARGPTTQAIVSTYQMLVLFRSSFNMNSSDVPAQLYIFFKDYFAVKIKKISMWNIMHMRVYFTRRHISQTLAKNRKEYKWTMDYLVSNNMENVYKFYPCNWHCQCKNPFPQWRRCLCCAAVNIHHILNI